MSKIRKIISVILCLSVIFAFTACTKNSNEQSKVNKLSIICTIFPEYDWVKQIIGDNINNVDLTLLLDNGVDLHNYQPTAEDIIKISNCDMFIYVGGESDEWVDDILNNNKNDNLVAINLLDVLSSSVKEEEVVEGMQADDDEDESTYDEHVWLSLKNAQTVCNVITDKLSSIDTQNAITYQNNTKAYIEQLNNLDNQYQDAVDNANQKTLLFGDRFPFRYLVDDYGLSYYAAFAGCSAETEASFETISFLASKVDELELNTVITIEGTDHSIAQTIVDNTKTKNQQILSLNSMQSTTSKDVENGTTYLSIMENNLSVLKEALA
jgi:zinc transport system substrate-binding protein